MDPGPLEFPEKELQCMCLWFRFILMLPLFKDSELTTEKHINASYLSCCLPLRVYL